MSDLAHDYQSAGFSQGLPWGRRAALIVIDFCMAYLEPGSPLYAAAEPARDATARLLAVARQAGIAVLHTQVRFAQGGADGGVFFRKVGALRLFEGDTPMGQPPAMLVPVPGEVVITKQYASAFFGTTLASTLTAMGVDTLVIAGVSTSGCVRATAVDACQHGFLPFVCRDAVGDRDPRPHESSLFDLQAKYAEVVDEAFVTERFRLAGAARA